MAVLDSAGVRWVEHAPEALAALPEWTPDPEPIWSAGDLDGPLAFSRIVDVESLTSGGAVVLDGATNQLHFLGPYGAHRATVGRSGDGPGEFRIPLQALALAGDTVAVWDFRAGRISEFDPDGDLARVVSVDLPHGRGDAVQMHALTDGYGVQGYGSLSDLDQVVGRPLVESVQLGRDGIVRGSYGEFSGNEYFRGEGLMGLTVLGAVPLSAGRGSDFVIGTAETTELRVFGPDRRLRQVIRWPDWDRTVTDEMFETVLTGQVELAPADQRANVEEMLRRGLVPAERFPPYNHLIADDEGRLWVGRDRRPEDRITFTSAPEAEWLIFGPDGVAEARMTTPTGLRIHAVADDRIYGVRTDDLGIPRVEGYRWTTGGS